MKYLKRAFFTIPDQVLSTFIVAGIILITWRGLVSLWNNPPSYVTILVVLFIGIGLGLIAAFAPENYGKAKQTPNEDNVDR